MQTGSELLVGLLGAVELVPVMAMALLGGAVADRFDRRRLLLLDQGAIVLVASALAACTFAGWTPVWVLFVLAGLLAGFGAVQSVVRTSMVPEPRGAGAAAARARAQLRPDAADDGHRAGGRRRDDQPARRRRRVHGRRAELPGDGRRGRGHAPAAARAPSRPARHPAVDRRGTGIRAPHQGPQGLLPDRPDGDDLRDAPRGVPGARRQRLRSGRGRHRAAVRLGRRRRHGDRARQRLARPRAPARPDPARGRRGVGRRGGAGGPRRVAA